MKILSLLLAGIAFGVTFFITTDELQAFLAGIGVYVFSVVLIPMIKGVIEFHKGKKKTSNSGHSTFPGRFSYVFKNKSLIISILCISIILWNIFLTIRIYELNTSIGIVEYDIQNLQSFHFPGIEDFFNDDL